MSTHHKTRRDQIHSKTKTPTQILLDLFLFHQSPLQFFLSNYEHRAQCSPKSMAIVGVGFRPTEQELVEFYLKHKLLADDPRVHVIPVIDLCDVEPSDVPGILARSPIRFGNPEWFFFSPVDFKYSNSKRVNRKTKCGFWKATGKDRDVRSRNTNTRIATKKTLVYYNGSVSCGVKSNWIIHEYHAVTFHESKRTFVLFRLMKRPGKTAESGTDALTCDEGVPSNVKVSEYEIQATAEGIPSGGPFTGVETIFQTTPQAETHFSPTQLSPTGIEQEEASLQDYTFNNAYFENENSIMKNSFGTTKENEFLNHIIADESLVIDEESIYTFVGNTLQSESLQGLYFENSDTDTEVMSKLDVNFVKSSVVSREYPNIEEYHLSKMLKLSLDVVDDVCFLSSGYEANRPLKESIFQDNFSAVESSSCDSTSN